MICLRKMAACVCWDMPDLDYHDVLHECYLAAIFNSTQELTCEFSLAVTRDVKNVFKGRKWREARPKGTRHRRYIIQPGEPESPENEYIDDLMVEQLMATLCKYDQELLEDRYWEELTFVQIGRRENISRPDVSRLHKGIIEELRYMFG